MKKPNSAVYRQKQHGRRYKGVSSSSSRSEPISNNSTAEQPFIKVVVRARPRNVLERKKFKKKDLLLYDSLTSQLVLPSASSSHRFNVPTFIPPSMNNSKAFAKCDIESYIHHVMNGNSSTIFAYGQTGSGKSHTIFGSHNDGFLHQASSTIAAVARTRLSQSKLSYKFSLTCVEIYNNEVYDLFSNQSSNKKLAIRESNGFYIEGLRTCNLIADSSNNSSISSDFSRVISKAGANRRISSHDLNDRSNRSHCIITIQVFQKHHTSSSENNNYSPSVGTLTVVDLAGSERLTDTKVTDDKVIEEAAYINKSLSTLVQVIDAIVYKKKHIPFRDSKLTMLLKSSLVSSSATAYNKTLMIACVPEYISNLGGGGNESIRTLEFALQRVAKIKRIYAENLSKSTTESSRVILDLKQQVERLENENRALRNSQSAYSSVRNKNFSNNSEDNVISTSNDNIASTSDNDSSATTMELEVTDNGKKKQMDDYSSSSSSLGISLTRVINAEEEDKAALELQKMLSSLMSM